jgi:16S rRNA (uracil1498-N3)-methyltransferase
MHDDPSTPTPLPRFYCPNLPSPPAAGTRLPDASLPLDDDQARHARKVLRLRDGDGVELFNGQGLVARGELRAGAGPATGARDLAAWVALTQVRQAQRLRPALDLAVAFPKGPRADDLVEQLSQAGVDELIPLRTRRGVVLPGTGKLARLQRAAVESAKQCGRNFLMTVAEPHSLDQVIARGHDVRILADPRPAGPESGHLMPPLFQAAARVLVLIGPEGGWAPEEEQAADAALCTRWVLGPHVMRIETAALAAGVLARYLAAGRG